MYKFYYSETQKKITEEIRKKKISQTRGLFKGKEYTEIKFMKNTSDFPDAVYLGCGTIEDITIEQLI